MVWEDASVKPCGTTATTHYGWDGDRIVGEETDNQRTTVVYEPRSFVPMLRIDATQQGQVLSASITDALGTPTQLVAPNDQPRRLAEPDGWAAVKNQRAVRNVTQPIRFQGQWHDEESGLYYNRHRYYDPQQGRYISQDPIGLAGGNNLYQYAAAPNIEVDPLGLRRKVYGLGAGPWSQPNMVRRQAEAADEMLRVDKETARDTAEIISNGAAMCSLAPALTSVCGPTSIATGLLAAGIDLTDGNYTHASAGVSSVISSELTGVIMKRIFFIRSSISNAVGVANSFVTQAVNEALFLPERKAEGSNEQ